MSMRITSTMITRQYQKNVNKALSNKNKAQTKAFTYRAFDAPSDDPFAAAQTYQIRREYDLNEDYQSNLSNVQSAWTTAESTLQSIYKVMSNANTSSGIQGITGTMDEKSRSAIATTVDQAKSAILSEMNSQYSGQYQFAGAGDTGAPFTLDADGNLLYRGINVDTGKNSNGASATIDYKLPDGTDKTMQLNFGKSIDDKLDGYSVKIATNTSADAGSENISATVDKGTKTITLNINNSASKSQTKQDLQNYLQSSSFQNEMKSGFAFSSSDMAGITVGGNASDVLSGNPSSLSWGAGIGSSLNGYQVVYDGTATGPGATVDAANKKITVSYQSGTTTVGDLQNFLRTDTSFQTALTGAAAFTGDVSQITISGVSDSGSDVLRNGSTASGSTVSSYVNLDDLANEKVLVDIGLGLKTDASGKVVEQSAFNASMPGIKFLGYGLNSDGTPKNVYSILTKLSGILNSSGNVTEAMAEKAAPYTSAFSSALDNMYTQQAEVGSKMQFLTSTSSYLDDVNLNLQDKDEKVEYVDPTDAITDYYMQLLSYQAALKSGTDLLQPTLMDFLK